jgi:hypothetical protein
MLYNLLTIKKTGLNPFLINSFFGRSGTDPPGYTAPDRSEKIPPNGIVLLLHTAAIHSPPTMYRLVKTLLNSRDQVNLVILLLL